MKKPTVFISYSHADSKFVNELADKLNASGVDVWIDKWKIKVGDSITGKINDGIGSSDFLIVVLSL
ncbi:MAG: toll/interleukin-1 receptor domain-containing protein [Anaerolineales bacterium]|nr:toll/interleukin-1 receptor domain-containing protein [Anaerolineales bacterium]